MELAKMQEFFVQEGMKADLRSQGQIQAQLRDNQKHYTKTKSFKKFFDRDDIKNPYADSRILFGNLKEKIYRILIGIDIDVGELLLADHLSRNGKKIDLILAHHPLGIALAGLSEVMKIQIDFLKNLGMAEKVAEGLMNKRIEEVHRRIHSNNHNRVVDAARLIGIPMMCCHTPADNHVDSYLQNLVTKKKPKSLQNIIDLLLKEPEYQEAAKLKAGPHVLAGKPQNKAGRVFVDMTGGTEGSKDIFGRLSQLGIDTLLCMHLSEVHFMKIKSEYINVVNAGHIASDNLGMNLLLDKLERKGKFEIVECSGFRRFRR